MLNIVIPMAGRGSRFLDQGFKEPKPLIPVGDWPMIRLVIENLRPRKKHRFIFLVLREHIETYGLGEWLRKWAGPETEVLGVEGVTQGAACTVLLAKGLVDNLSELMIANCDQFVDVDINEYLGIMDSSEADGLIMTMYADDPKWSFVKLSPEGWVEQVEEKKVISNQATVGIYNFKKGSDFVSAAEEMVSRDMRVNNEFYVAPTYNLLIERGHRVKTLSVGAEFDGMYGLGTPNDLRKFQNEKVHILDRYFSSK